MFKFNFTVRIIIYSMVGAFWARNWLIDGKKLRKFNNIPGVFQED